MKGWSGHYPARALRCFAVFAGMLGLLPAKAEDVLIRNRLSVGVVSRMEYTDLVLEAALRHTRQKYGPYRMEWVVGNVARERALQDLLSGDKYNAAVMASQPSWEQQLLPVWIPLDMGLSNYRIGLTNANTQAKISAVRTLNELKALRTGVASGWSSRKVLEADGFNVTLGENFEPLLKMLMAERIDYFPRGVNEVFAEYDDRSAANPDLAIEQDVVVEYPLPGYVFVSPTAPRLHQRLSEGLEMMVRDGTLRRMVLDYHAKAIKRANFCERRVFHVENPFISDKTPLNRKELWFDPYDPKTGICVGVGSKTAKK